MKINNIAINDDEVEEALGDIARFKAASVDSDPYNAAAWQRISCTEIGTILKAFVKAAKQEGLTARDIYEAD